jgi:alkylhydroperoxidase/carboxymuconolactone decarboxylase family protein YurZ
MDHLNHPVLEKIRQTVHPTRLWMEMFAEYDPDVLTAWHEYGQKILKHKELEPKTRELLIVAIDAVVEWKYITSHINQAFELGASIQELVEVMVVCGFLMGPHAWSFGLTYLDEVIKERKQAGLPTPRTKKDVPKDLKPKAVYP